MELSPQQRKAIESTAESVLILAGPGTGKTRVIIQKMVAACRRGLKPERVLAMTFSNRATEEIRDRLQATDPGIAALAEVATLHSWCYELVKRQNFRLGFQKSPQLLSESQAQVLFRQLANSWRLPPFLKTANFEGVIDDLMDLFSRCKDEGLWPEDLAAYARKKKLEDDTQGAEWESLSQLYSSFQNYCLERSFVDFGDAILFALRLLQDFAFVREEIQSQYDLILVDEFQDSNWTQVELLRLLHGSGSQIVIVGDDDQSIYQFRGASASAFRFFLEAFPQTEVIELTETYRMSPEISAVASELIQANGRFRFRPDKKIIPLKKSENLATEVLQFSSFEDEAHFVAEEIQKLPGPRGEVAILYRAHKHAEYLRAEFERRGIRFQSIGQEALFDQAIIQDLLSFLKVLSDDRNSIDLLRLMDSPFLNLPAEFILNFCRSAAKERKDYLSFARDQSILELKPFIDFIDRERAQRARKLLSELVFDLIAETKVISRLLPDKQDDLKYLAQFHSQVFEWEKIQSEKTLDNLLPYLERLFRTDRSFEKSEFERDPEKVSLMSVHASKGLEFDHVFVISLVGRRFPSNYSQPTWPLPEGLRREEAPTKEAHLAEERRLLYVASTRAKKKLHLTTIEKKGTKPCSFLTADIIGLKTKSEVLNWKTFPARSAEQVFQAPPAKAFQRTRAASTPAPTVRNQSLRLSFTQLEAYEKCPQAYFFKYDLKIPTRANPQLAFGTAIHDALEKFFKVRLQGEEPPSESLVELFKKSFAEQKLENPDLPDFLNELGVQQLENFYDAHLHRWPKTLAIEEKFNLKIGPHLLTGKIDRADHGPNGVDIVDYKTGRAKSSADQKFADESLQLSLYAMAAEECFDWKVNSLNFYYLTDQSTLSTKRSSKDFPEIRSKVESIASRILQEDFAPTPDQMTCSYCDYNRICPAAKI